MLAYRTFLPQFDNGNALMSEMFFFYSELISRKVKFDVIFTYELTYSTRTAVPTYALRHEDEGLTYAEPLCTDIKFVTERLERKSLLNFIETRTSVSNTKHVLRQQAFLVELRYMFCYLAEKLKES
jgi:hypothetical protein